MAQSRIVISSGFWSRNVLGLALAGAIELSAGMGLAGEGVPPPPPLQPVHKPVSSTKVRAVFCA